MPTIYETFRDIIVSDLKKNPAQTTNTVSFISSYDPASNGGTTIANMINQAGDDGDTIFSHALSFDHQLMIKLLLENGANPNNIIHTHSGGIQKPILFAIDQGRVETTKLLITGSGSSAKSNINEKFTDGSSLLTKSLYYLKGSMPTRYPDYSTPTFLIDNGLAITINDLATIANFKVLGNPTVEALTRIIVSKGKDENGASITSKFNAATVLSGNLPMTLIITDQQLKDAVTPIVPAINVLGDAL